jgi:hypothetical protein
MNSYDPYPQTSGDPRAEAGRFNQLPRGKAYALASYSGTVQLGAFRRVSASIQKGDQSLLSGDNIVIPRDGLYDVAVWAAYTGSASAGIRSVKLFTSSFGGSDGLELVQEAATLTNWADSGCITLPFSKGDVLRLEFFVELANLPILYAYLSVAQR